MGTSWRTTAIGIAVIVVTALGPVLQHYVPVAGLDWNTTCMSIAALLAGGGLLVAKDFNVHGGTVETGTRPAGEVQVPPQGAPGAPVVPPPPAPPKP